jgi:hypothetical protein
MTVRTIPPGQLPHTWGVMHFGSPDGRKLSIAGETHFYAALGLAVGSCAPLLVLFARRPPANERIRFTAGSEHRRLVQLMQPRAGQRLWKLTARKARWRGLLANGVRRRFAVLVRAPLINAISCTTHTD